MSFICTGGRIGILNAPIIAMESDRFATVYIGFVEPSEISEDIRANITFFTADGTAEGNTHYCSLSTSLACVTVS